MADLLSLQQITEYKEAFAFFDKDGDGYITLDDLQNVFAFVGQNVSMQRLKEMLNEADLDSNGVIDFPEFLTLIAARMNDPEEKELELKRAFQLYDLGNTGYITVSNLRYVMNRLGCPLTCEQVSEMMREGDTDNDGRLDFSDFKTLMMQRWEEVINFYIKK